jgi:hypothetical protein
MTKKDGGLTIKENRLIADYAVANGLVPCLADVPNHMAYFRTKAGRTIKKPLSHIDIELKRLREKDKQS